MGLRKSKCHLEVVGSAGSGSYGQVKIVKAKDKRLYALKQQDASRGISNLLEIDVLRRIQHPSIVNAIEVILPLTGEHCVNVDEMGLVMPLAPYSLSQLITSPSLSYNDRLALFYQMACGLHALHQEHICHCDLKSANVLVFKDNASYRASLADFGLAIIIPSGQLSRKIDRLFVTVTYRPPEILAGLREYGYFTDIWSLGVLGLQILTGNNPMTKLDNLVDIVSEYIKLNPNTKLPEQWGDLSWYIRNETAENKALSFREFISRAVPKNKWGANRKETIRELLTPSVEDSSALEHLVDLISDMLSIDYLYRPNIETVISHKAFDSVKIGCPSGLTWVPQQSSKWIGHTDTYASQLIYYFLYQLRVRYPEMNIAVLFMFIDLFHRALENFQLDPKTINLTIITTFWMAMKYWSITNADMIAISEAFNWLEAGRFDITIADILMHERTIIHLLGGIINRRYLYDRAQSFQDLLHVYPYLGQIGTYLILDLDHLWLKPRGTYQEIPIPKGDKTIGQYLAAIPN